MSHNNEAFVILPFEDEFEKLYHDKIVPLLEENNYSVKKADSLSTQRNIIEDIIDGITNADLIIADLTGLNANVFYELGIAHGLGIPTVLITQDVEELPFDLSAYKNVEYSLRYDEIEEFSKELSDICSSHNEGEIAFGSPVSDYTNVNIKGSNRRNSSESVKTSENKSSADSDKADNSSDTTRETDSEKGIIEYMINIENYESKLNDIMDDFIDGSSSTRSNIARDVDKLKRTYDNNKPETRRDVNDRARDISADIVGYSQAVRRDLQQFELYLGLFNEEIQKVIEQADGSNDRKVLIELQDKIKVFTNTGESMLKEIEKFNHMLDEVKGINKKLDDAIKTLNETTSPYERNLQSGLAKSERYDSLIKNKIADSSD